MAETYPIRWDESSTRLYETGVDHGVLYPVAEDGTYKPGVAWNGLTAANEAPTGAEPTALWADNIKYLNIMSAEEFAMTIEAYTYPDEFAACNGEAALAEGVTFGQQKRKPFGLCYRTILGNDVDGNDHGYKLHLVYGCLASPSAKDYATVNDSPEAVTFSWEISTTPVEVSGTNVKGTFKPTAYLVVDSTKFTGEKATKLASLEDILYGKGTTAPELPLPGKVAEILSGE